jgi:hypothetical protein
MSGLLAATAALLARSLAGLLPIDKAEWGRAMVREIDEMDNPRAALLFALGCAGWALKERFRTMDMMIRLSRTLVPAAMLMLGVVTLASARRLMPQDEAVGMSFVLVAAAFLIGGLLTFLRGPRVLVRAAGVMLGLHFLVSIWMLVAPASLPGGPPEPIQRGLLIEGFVIWILLLGAGLFLAAASPNALSAAKNHD